MVFPITGRPPRQMETHRIVKLFEVQLEHFRMHKDAAQKMATDHISRESKTTLEMYGAKPGAKSTADSQSVGDKPLAKDDDPAFANNCLLARRLVESGVRFVPLYD